jgi:hypothetical protein
MPDFIFDNTVLSNFAAVGRTALISSFFENNAFTTIEVVDELRRGIVGPPPTFGTPKKYIGGTGDQQWEQPRSNNAAGHGTGCGCKWRARHPTPLFVSVNGR